MKVLVTGGAGFIGSHIVDKLIENHFEVVIVDNLSSGNKKYVNSNAYFYQVDITEKNLEKVFVMERPDYVIHQAAQIDVQYSLKDPLFDAKVNILGTIHLLECCIKYNVKKIVYASSAAVYGNPNYLGIDEDHPQIPMSFYGISKYTPENYIRVFSHLHDFNYTVFRYSNVYGIRQDPKGEGGVVSVFIDKLLRGEQLPIYGNGEQTRDFVYVEDIANANVAALTFGHNKILNISTNQSTSINQLLQLMNEINGSKMEPIYHSERSGDIRDSYLNNEKALRLLPWRPQCNLRVGLEKTMKHYRELYSMAKK